ncbi:MAG: hypothetical protein QW250_01865, partial [Sulfolobaceae archaeon]
MTEVQKQTNIMRRVMLDKVTINIGV